MGKFFFAVIAFVFLECIFNFDFTPYVLLHFVHLKSSFFWCTVTTCAFRSLLLVNCFSHESHLNFLIPSWTVSTCSLLTLHNISSFLIVNCFSMILTKFFEVNVFPQMSQLKFFFSLLFMWIVSRFHLQGDPNQSLLILKG